MNYLDIGYNDSLLRPLEASFTEQIGIDSATNLDQISGNQVRGDKITSLNKRMSIDLENDSFIISDGGINRVELGRLSDGSIGIALRDNLGNTLLNVTENTNVLQSADGNIQLDFIQKRFIVKDETGAIRVLLGFDAGGF